MARNKKNTKRHAAKIDLRCLLNQKIGLYRFRFQKVTPIFEKIRIGDKRNSIFVKSDLAFACPFDFGRVIEMVEVAVREHQQIESDPQIPDPIRRHRSEHQSTDFPLVFGSGSAFVSKIPPIKV